MLIIGIMCIGIVVGRFLFPQKYKSKNEALQVVCTALLIFSMGVMLGKRENFFGDLASLGFQSFLFFIIPTGLSLFLTFFLTERFMKKKKAKKEEPGIGETKAEKRVTEKPGPEEPLTEKDDFLEEAESI